MCGQWKLALILALSWGASWEAWGQTGAGANSPAGSKQEDAKQTVATAEGNSSQLSIAQQKFAESLKEVKFIGSFSVKGQDDQPLNREEYYILSAEKLEQGDYWVITTRIKYGDHDVTVPLTMEVKFADQTPVITVDKLVVPGLGTFDARVLVHDQQYAGMWSHGEVGGHLFGKIVKLSAEELQELKQRTGRRNRSSGPSKLP